ncbi:MAG: hypothetical protein KIT87_26270 [Anaerolineae bacterium]|nr:hypothetical protein [Anaerolineae bacterium]
MTYFSWRWMPHYQYMRRFLDEGYVGREFQCLMRFTVGFGRTPRYSWRFDGQRSNGALADLGAHMIDLARWFVGDIARVMAHTAVYVQQVIEGAIEASRQGRWVALE